MTHILRFHTEIGKIPVVLDPCPWLRLACPWPWPRLVCPWPWPRPLGPWPHYNTDNYIESMTSSDVLFLSKYLNHHIETCFLQFAGEQQLFVVIVVLMTQGC